MLMIKTQNHSQGFTLIELVMVLLIVAVTGTILVKGMSGLQDATRDNITRERVNQIKQAIINVQTINGTPTVSGFVADVGRLPYCIQELINGTCANVSTGVSGWKGPYLQTSDGTFYDGWGNPKLATDNGNFGWSYNIFSQKYQTSAPATLTQCPESSSPFSHIVLITGGATGICDTLTLQSKGSDGALDTTLTTPPAEGTYEADYPPYTYSAPTTISSTPPTPVLIQPDDWIIDLSTTGLNAQFNHPPQVSPVISPSPMISTACTPGSTTITSTTSLIGNTLTTLCSTGTSVASTIICPAGYTATAPAVVIGATAITITCTAPTPATNTSTVSVSCLNGWTLPAYSLASNSPASNQVSPTPIIATCSGTATVSAVTSATTSFSQTCSPSVPATLLILANDLYGNSIIPAPIASPWLLPSTCSQSNTVNFIDNPPITTPLTPQALTTPVAIGNWNICTFPSSAVAQVPSDFPSPIPLTNLLTAPPTPTTCSSVVLLGTPPVTPYLSSSPALYSTTITVLPRTQPSVAW